MMYIGVLDGCVVDVLLLVPMILTIIIEVPIFFVCGYHSIKYCFCFLLANGMSNLLLNEFLSVYFEYVTIMFIVICEFIVVLLEFIISIYVIKKNYKKLFLVILLSNTASFLSGFIINIFYG